MSSANPIQFDDDSFADVLQPEPEINIAPAETATVFDQAKPASRGQGKQIATYAMTQDEFDLECEKEFPVFPLKATAGPVFEENDFYGPLGYVAKKLCVNSEACVPAVYLNLLFTLGCAFDRAAYFNVDDTRHYTTDFLACVGDSSVGRKGTSSDAAESFLKLVCPDFTKGRRSLGGFGSPQAVIERIKDSSTFQKYNSKTKSYETVIVPGVEDKRLVVRENELSNLFKLIADNKTRAGELFRNGWDGKPLRNLVAGKTDDGESKSLNCQEPHLAIIGSSTPSLVKATLPIGADKSGDGNRFIWCWTEPRQVCPHGGPPIDWSAEMIEYAGESIPILIYFQNAIHRAKYGDSDVHRERLIGKTVAASKYWTHLYIRLRRDQRTGFLGGMTSRAAAHIRRVAMILALIDTEDSVDVKHLKAAEAIWNYSQDSAQFIFRGYSQDQEKLLVYAQSKGTDGIVVGRELHALFGRHKSAQWIRAQVRSLADGGFLTEANGKYLFKKF